MEKLINIKSEVSKNEIEGSSKKELRKLLNLMKGGKSKAALKKAKIIEENSPNDFDILKTIGQFYFSVSETNRGLEIFKKILLETTFQKNYFEEISQLLITKELFQELLILIDLAETHKADPNLTFNEKCIGLGGIGKPNEGILKIEAELNQGNHKNERTLTILGQLYYDKGSMAEAIDCFIEVLKINSSNATTYGHLALIFIEQGRTKEAVLCVEHGLTIDPNHGKLHELMGQLNLEEGAFDEATVSLVKGLEEDPTKASTYNNLGVALAQMDRKEEAVLSFMSAVNLDESYSDAQENLAKVMESINR